jgi:hypothetical protein
VVSADAKPTQQSYEVFSALSAQLQVELDRLDEVIQDEIPAFNALVNQHSVPAIIVREPKEEGGA